MNETVFNFLDEESASLLRAALGEEKEEEGPDLFAEAEQRAIEIGKEIKSSLDSKDSLNFARELTGFLDKARKRALQVKNIQEEIAAKEAQVDETQLEIKQLISGRDALAEAVNQTLKLHQDKRYEYDRNEFAIATLEDRVVMRRSELTTLRRQLKELKEQEGERNGKH
jgi:chromosome segregation ATPase